MRFIAWIVAGVFILSGCNQAQLAIFNQHQRQVGAAEMDRQEALDLWCRHSPAERAAYLGWPRLSRMSDAGPGVDCPAPPAPAGWVDLGHGVFGPVGFLALRWCESRDNYSAVSASGTYRGAYQFSRSTWTATVVYGGRPDLSSVDPAGAAPADQDWAAVVLYGWQGAAPWPHCGASL